MEIGEPVAVAIAGKVGAGKAPVVTARILEVSLDTTVKVRAGDALVAPPHWSIDEDPSDGRTRSRKPAVYLVKPRGGSKAVRLKVKIGRAENVSGQGKVVGRLGDLEISGPCPLSVGEHAVNAEIAELPDSIQSWAGDVHWKLEAAALRAPLALNATRLEVFVVLDRPLPRIYAAKGVWVEALRLLCDRAGVIGAKKDSVVAKSVASYCHGRHRVAYDTTEGRAHYGVGPLGGVFKLGNYLKRLKPTVNCYDQAGAIQSLAGALGVDLGWIFLEPYGFIRATRLVGVPGLCNNPFYLSNGSRKLVDRDDPRRTAFFNHAFCKIASNVVDACAGPHLGTESKEAYLRAAIDLETRLYEGRFPPGTVDDMVEPSGVMAVE